MTTLSIPQHDLHEFAGLPEACRKEIREWLSAMTHLAHAPRVGAGIAAVARQLGKSPQSVRRYYDDFRRSGDWRVFVNRAKYGAQFSALPPDFIQHWKRLCEQNQRKNRPAHRALLRAWQKGEEIPGYDVSPAPSDRGIPAGWSYRNLMRHAPSRFELTAMRDGLGAALAKYGPQILTTRIGLWVGSHYMIDDVTRDLKALLLGQSGQIVRIQELGVLDVYSGDRFAVHRRPEFTREDGKKDRIKEREMRCLVAAVLRNTGYSPKGTVFVVEGGTAAIRKDLESWMSEHVSPQITVSRPGATGKAQAIAGYWGRGGGNPRHKAPLESLHNLLHNEAGALAAQTGHDRNAPEWLHGLEAITEGVIKQLRQLPPEQAALLAVPMLEYWQALTLLTEIDELVAHRTDHKLEGWAACGHTTVEYRRDLLSNDWLSPQEFLALPPADQQILATVAGQMPAMRRARQLSPREVFSGGAGALVKVPDHIIALMFCDRDLGDDLRRTKRLTKGGTLEVDDIDVSPETMIFEGYALAPDGSKVRLDERREYGVVSNVFDPSSLWVYDSAGGYIGAAPRRDRITRFDEPARLQALGNRNETIAAMLGPLRDRHPDAAANIAAMQRHNAKVTAGEAVTKEAIAKERKLNRAARKITPEEVSAAMTDIPTAPATSETISTEEISRLLGI